MASRSPRSLTWSTHVSDWMLVVVDDDGDLVQAAVGGRLERLPELALLQLAVAGEDVDAPGRPARRSARTKPRALEMPMPSDPVFVTICGVAARRDGRGARRAGAAGGCSSKSSRPSADEHGVQARRVVPLGGEVAVAVAHRLEVQPRDDVQRAEGRPKMTRACALDHVQDVQAARVRERGSPLVGITGDQTNAIELLLGDMHQHVRRDPTRPKGEISSSMARVGNVNRMKVEDPVDPPPRRGKKRRLQDQRRRVRGTTSEERGRPPREGEAHSSKETIEQFHRLYFESKRLTWGSTSWLGHRAQKCPLDLWIYQEIIWKTRPNLIIETGTARGGSALYLATLFDLIGEGEVISIDLRNDDMSLPTHGRIRFVTGNTIDPQVASWVAEQAAGRRTMVILDSDHSRAHVGAELDAYAPMVSPGCYLIVEDTNVNGNPVLPDIRARPC